MASLRARRHRDVSTRIALVLASFWLASCAPPPGPYSCQSTSNCASAGIVETCCTTRACEFRIADGQVFPCVGLDCASARAAVAAFCGPICPDAWVADDAWVDQDATVDAAMDTGPALDAQPCVR
jgi:hypothetical protein